MQEKYELSFYEVKYIAEESEKTEEQKSCLVRLQILVENYKKSILIIGTLNIVY